MLLGVKRSHTLKCSSVWRRNCVGKSCLQRERIISAPFSPSKFHFLRFLRSWVETHSVLLRVVSSLSCGRLMTACPSSLSGPTRARWRTWTCSVLRSDPPPPPPRSSCGRSKVASSFHTGVTLFSTTDVWNFSLPTWRTAYASLVPLLPFTLRPRAWSAVTWALVGHHCLSVSDMLSASSSPEQTAGAQDRFRGTTQQRRKLSRSTPADSWLGVASHKRRGVVQKHHASHSWQVDYFQLTFTFKSAESIWALMSHDRFFPPIIIDLWLFKPGTWFCHSIHHLLNS